MFNEEIAKLSHLPALIKGLEGLKSKLDKLQEKDINYLSYFLKLQLRPYNANEIKSQKEQWTNYVQSVWQGADPELGKYCDAISGKIYAICQEETGFEWYKKQCTTNPQLKTLLAYYGVKPQSSQPTARPSTPRPSTPSRPAPTQTSSAPSTQQHVFEESVGEMHVTKLIAALKSVYANSRAVQPDDIRYLRYFINVHNAAWNTSEISRNASEWKQRVQNTLAGSTLGKNYDDIGGKINALCRTQAGYNWYKNQCATNSSLKAALANVAKSFNSNSAPRPQPSQPRPQPSQPRTQPSQPRPQPSQPRTQPSQPRPTYNPPASNTKPKRRGCLKAILWIIGLIIAWNLIFNWVPGLYRSIFKSKDRQQIEAQEESLHQIIAELEAAFDTSKGVSPVESSAKYKEYIDLKYFNKLIEEGESINSDNDMIISYRQQFDALLKKYKIKKSQIQ